MEINKKKHSAFEYIKLIFKIDKRFILVLVINILINLFYDLVPIGIIGYLGTIYQKSPNMEGYKYVIYACIGFTLGRMLFSAISIYNYNIMTDRISRYLANYVAKQLYQKIQEVDYDTYQSMDFLNSYQKAINEASDYMESTFWSFDNFITSLTSLLSIGTIFSFFSPLILIYGIIIGIIVFFISSVTSKLNHKLGDKNMQLVRERGYIKRVFFLKDSAIDVKTTEITPMYLKRNDKIGNQVLKNFDSLRVKSQILYSISEILLKTVVVVALSFVAYTTIKTQNIVILASLMGASYTLTAIIDNLSSGIANLKENIVYREDYYRVMDTVSTLEISGKSYDKEMKNFEKIEFKDVSFTYPASFNPTIKNLNMKIQNGEKIAIVGENGAGKTTFIKLLLRLYDASSGTITYNDICYTDIKPYNIREKFACVFQNYQIFAVSVIENILMRKPQNKEDEKRALDALKKVGLYDKVMSHEKGIYANCTKEFDKEGMELSGGERQKLVIARIFASDAEILLLDEPNSALDPLAESKVFEEIFNYSVDKTLIFISHRFSTTISADKIYLFEDGEIKEQGTHEELMKNENGSYRHMFLVQAEEYQKVGDDYE